MRFLRRIGTSPGERGDTSDMTSCPDIWELDDGRFAVIGTDMTDDLTRLLPGDAKVCPYERVVVISRKTLVTARKDIPEQ
jgi:hypothetical protein